MAFFRALKLQPSKRTKPQEDTDPLLPNRQSLTATDRRLAKSSGNSVGLQRTPLTQIEDDEST